MKFKQSYPGFELGLPCQFSVAIQSHYERLYTLTHTHTHTHTHSHTHTYIYIYVSVYDDDIKLLILTIFPPYIVMSHPNSNLSTICWQGKKYVDRISGKIVSLHHHKIVITSMTQKCIWWWSVKYIFVVINLISTLTRSGSICYGLIKLIRFEIICLRS